MKAIDHVGIIWAIARKDIAEALRNLVMLSVILGVLVLVGSSQIGVLLQQMSGKYNVYINDTTGYDLAYSLNTPPTLNLIAVTSDEELNQALINNPGTTVGLKLTTDNLGTLSVDASYAHWVDRDEASTIIDITEQFLRSELGKAVTTVHLQDNSVYPEGTTNRMVNSMSIILIIALFAFCGSLVPMLLAEEKRRKTMDVLMVSPASVGDIISGKAIAGMFYGLLTACVTVILLNRYILHWEIAVLVSLLGTMLAVTTGLLLGVLINSYQAMNIYSAGLLFLLFLPLIPEVMGLDIAEGFASLLQLFPIPALMALTRMMYINPVSVDVILPNTGILILWVAGIGLMATWLGSRMNT